MEFKSAVVEKIYPQEEGTGKKGPWKKKQVVFRENLAVRYPDKALVTCMNEKCDLVANLREGDVCEVSWSMDVREYSFNDKQTGAPVTRISQENFLLTLNGQV